MIRLSNKDIAVVVVISQLVIGMLFYSPAPALEAPVLKWQNGGCHASWCETGWYSSPAVADLDGDGKMEVIGAAYTVFVLDGEDGSVRYSIDPEGGRVWPGVAVADVDGDGQGEFITAHGDGYVHMFDTSGRIAWSGNPVSGELRGLAVSDLDGDGTMEVVVTGAVGSKVNTWVYEHDGRLRSGWPQLAGDDGYAHGVFNDNAAVGDMDNDGRAEIVVPSDVHYICAYDSNGKALPADGIYGGKTWGLVGIWESPEIELRGWGRCRGERKERFRTNFARGAAVLSDLDNDGTGEVVVTGNVYDCAGGDPSARYTGVYIFNGNRTRFAREGFDWNNPPVDTGAPLSVDYNRIASNQPNPVVADLDGDGMKEILFSSYDGRVHAVWLDKTEHGNWPFSVHDGNEGHMRFASEPLVADLDGDGKSEVLFTSWVEKGSGKTGDLFVLNSLGGVLHKVALPAAYGSPDWNGGLAAPTLADIDGDADLEIVVNTAHSGFAAYDLPGTEGATVLWGTGRGNMRRTGVPDYPATIPPPLIRIEANGRDSSRVDVSSGDPVSIRIQLDSAGYTGLPVELWAPASTPFGWYSFVEGAGWTMGRKMHGEGHFLTSFGPVEVLNSPLPEGVYHFYFGVDPDLDHVLNPRWWESVQVNVTSP